MAAIQGAPTAASDAVANINQTDIQKLRDNARMWSARHRDDLAAQMLEKAARAAPHDSAPLADLIRIQLRLGQTDAAQATLTRLQALAPDTTLTRQLEDEHRIVTRDRQAMAEVRLLARSGMTEQAVVRLFALFPRGAPGGALGAEYYEILGSVPARRNEAIRSLRGIVAADPGQIDMALTLALLLNARDGTRAEANRIVRALARRNDIEPAKVQDAWRRILRSAGDDADYLSSLHEYLRLADNDDELRQQARDIARQRATQERLARDPDYIDQQRGIAALENGDLEVAEALLMRAAERRNHDADAVGHLGLLRLRQGRHDEAHTLFLRAARLASDNRAKWRSLAGTAQFWGTLAQARSSANAGQSQESERLARAALAMQPRNPDAQGVLVDALLAQQSWDAAEPALQELLGLEPLSVTALRSALVLYRNTDRLDQAEFLIESHRNRFTAADDLQTVDRLRADILVTRAEQLLTQSRNGQALDAYEAAVRLAPDDAWTRYALARLYRDLGLPQFGRTALDEGLKVSSAADMRYAAALYRSSLDDVTGATTVLAAIPPQERTASMNSLARQLEARQMLAAAQEAVSLGDRARAANALDQVVALDDDDPYLLASVGSLWIDAGEHERGLALLREWMTKHPERSDVDLRLRYGDLLGSAGRDVELDRWLAEVRADSSLTQQQLARLEDQALRSLLRQADEALERGDYNRARAILERASPAGRRDTRHVIAMADLERLQGHFATAQTLLTEHAATLPAGAPDHADLQLSLARVMEQSGQRRQALTLVRRVRDEAQATDIDTRLSAARRLLSLGRATEAKNLVTALRETFPTHPDITLSLGQIMQRTGRYRDAYSLYQTALDQEREAATAPRRDGRTAARTALDELDARRNPMIEAGWQPAQKSGTPGVSDYRAHQVPIHVQLPWGFHGHFFGRFDSVRLDAGALDVSDPDAYALRTFGTYAALATPPTTQVGDRHQAATGVAVGIGYEADDWRVDVGATPLGFPVTSLVGGIRYRFDAGPTSLSVNVSRRPKTSSELAYAGLRDPWTGAVWGGVTRSGVDLHVGWEMGRNTLFADLGVGVLTGEQVRTNRDSTLRLGFTRPVFHRSGMTIASGLIGNLWRYSHNENFYTYGHGGYYSPQRYWSVGVPVEWNGSGREWSWEVAANLGVSQSRTDASPYYPLGLPIAANATSPTDALVFPDGGSDSAGFSYSLRAVVEHRFTLHWTGGMRVDIDRSQDYAPSSALLYVRYAFRARRTTPHALPAAVRLYADY